MKAFMDKEFMLQSPVAQHLYHTYAADMPICDYHCHLSPKEIYANRRFETIADGLRWGDIKRYGIVIDRFDDSAYNDDNTTGFTVAATLGEKDLRRALQLPQEVITAGLEANPRNENRPDHPFCQ